MQTNVCDQYVGNYITHSFQWNFETRKSPGFFLSLQLKQLSYCSGFPPFCFGEHLNPDYCFDLLIYSDTAGGTEEFTSITR